MSRKLFEFFFDPDELEPFYSELTGSKRWATRNDRPKSKVSERKPASQVPRQQLTTERGRDEDVESAPEVAQSGSEVNDRAESGSGRREQLADRETYTNAGGNPADSKSTQQRTNTNRPDHEEEIAAETRQTARTRVRSLLSVHALGQYVFCPRSAILAAERGDERDIDEPLPRLTFLPSFDLARIEEALSLKLKQFALAVLLVVALTISMIVSSRDEIWSQFYLAAGTLFLGLLWAANLLTAIVTLAVRRFVALHAEASEPLESLQGTQPINWWSMLNAGFEPITYQRPFQHPELPLEGCPWRVLHKDSLRIPVIRTGGDRLGNGKDQLFPKNEVRLVAYALLLEADGHLKVPYGLVFPSDSPHGLAFAITDNHRRQAVQLLSDFEKQLNDSQQRNVQPSLPENRNRCANCDYGKPIVTSIREVNSLRKAGEHVVVLQSHSEQIFRCDCGDRFGSAPPHRDSVRMGLRAVLE